MEIAYFNTVPTDRERGDPAEPPPPEPPRGAQEGRGDSQGPHREIRQPGRPQQPQGNRWGITLLCPEHRVELVPSVKNRTMDFIDELGQEIPASWFHKLADGKSHSVYQTKAIWVGR